MATPYNRLLEPLEVERFVVVAVGGLLSNLEELEILMLEETKHHKILSRSCYEKMYNYDSILGFGLGHTTHFYRDSITFTSHIGLGMGWNASYQSIKN